MEKSKPFSKRLYFNNDDSAKTFIFAMLLPYLFSFVVSFVLSIVANGNKEVFEGMTSSPVYLILSGFIAPISFVLLFVLYCKAFNISFKASTISNKISAKEICISIFVGIVSIFGLYMIVNCQDGILSMLGYHFDDAFKALPMSHAGWLVLYAFVFGLLPAFCEELVFRGMILQGFRKNFSDWTSIILSAFLFMLMHGNLQQSLYPFLFGIILGWIALRTGNFVCSFLLHFFNNFVTILFGYLEYNPAINFKFLPFKNVWWYYLVAVALVLVTGLIVFLIDRFVFKGKNKNDIEKEKTNRPSAFLWVGLVVGIILFVMSSVAGFLGKN